MYYNYLRNLEDLVEPPLYVMCGCIKGNVEVVEVLGLCSQRVLKAKVSRKPQANH